MLVIFLPIERGFDWFGGVAVATSLARERAIRRHFELCAVHSFERAERIFVIVFHISVNGKLDVNARRRKIGFHIRERRVKTYGKIFCILVVDNLVTDFVFFGIDEHILCPTLHHQFARQRYGLQNAF